MTGRVLAETAVAAGITLVLLFLGSGLLALENAPSAGDAFFRSGPANVLGILGVALVVWVLLILAANAVNRRRSSVVKALTNVVVTVAVAGLSLGFWAAFAAVAGGFADLVVTIALVDAALFAITALIAIAVTHLALLRTPRGV
ncbi:MAG TPA: hypothetical protein VIL55_07035 [Naasia sp.]|jgi:malonyl CoA-acyl carrier protein transacylase